MSWGKFFQYIREKKTMSKIAIMSVFAFQWTIFHEQEEKKNGKTHNIEDHCSTR